MNNIIIKSNFETHPFKEGVAMLIEKHFTEAIAKRFYGVLEVEKYNKKSRNILKQLKDERYVLELYYNQPSGFSVYICDVFSHWPKEVVELQLLKMITDKCVKGEIGQDWGSFKGRISLDVTSGKHQTIVDKNGDAVN
jgi:hypothetical protein